MRIDINSVHLHIAKMNYASPLAHLNSKSLGGGTPPAFNKGGQPKPTQGYISIPLIHLFVRLI